jgi:hypothetical protein
MGKRKNISKKLRFEVFKRDGFKCVYCGNSPPNVLLEIDHIQPISKGGDNDINNLVTSCFDCNRGKAAVPLSKVPRKINENLEVLKEKESQIREYRKFIKKIENRLSKDADEISAIFESKYKDLTLSNKFKETSLKKFLNKLPLHEVKTSMDLAVSKFGFDNDDEKDQMSEKTIKYFCGICWNKIREREDPYFQAFRDLKKYWEYQPRGSGYLPDKTLNLWLRKYSIEEIKDAMDEARGTWRKLADKLGN